MGFFSWKTQDTNKSISNKWTSRGALKVTMLDDKGNEWREEEYEGYGKFGGKDFHELLAEMNGINSDLEGEEYMEFMRSEGIKLAYSNAKIKSPNLIEQVKDWEYCEQKPENCEYQGYFYGNIL